MIELLPILSARQTLPLNVSADCVRETDASIARYRRSLPPKSHVDCALPPIAPDTSIRVSFWKKNRAQSSVLLLQITADCARRTYVCTDGHFFNFDNYIYRFYFVEKPKLLYLFCKNMHIIICCWFLQIPLIQKRPRS